MRSETQALVGRYPWDEADLTTRPKRVPDRRICLEPDCWTVLSAYNVGDTCWAHTYPDVKPTRSNSVHRR